MDQHSTQHPNHQLSISHKRCARCQTVKPAADFWRMTDSKDGFQHWCKVCMRTYQVGRTSRLKQRAIASREYYYTRREEILTRQSEYYHRNRDTIRERERVLKPIRAARKAHRILLSQIWRDHNRDTIAVSIERRRAREMGLPDLWTVEQWQQTLHHFGERCAVCGHEPDGVKRFLAADHWIALNDPRPHNPGTVAWNMVPLCHGIRGCNNSKSDKDAHTWLTSRYGKSKGTEIYNRISDYLAALSTAYNTGQQPSRLQRFLDWLLSWSVL